MAFVGGMILRRTLPKIVDFAPKYALSIGNSANRVINAKMAVATTGAAMGPNAFHFKLERYFAAATVPIIPAAYFIHGPYMDFVLTAAIVLNAHWGAMSVVQDYARPVIIGEKWAGIAPKLVYVVTVILLAGLMHFNYNDVGLIKAFQMAFSL